MSDARATRCGVRRLQDSRGAYCFFDTSHTISEQSETVLALADLVLIPIRPSPADRWTVSETVALVKAAEKPFLFVITQAKTRAGITAQILQAQCAGSHAATRDSTLD